MMKFWKACPDCGAAIGELHDICCDIERCPHCGGQALGCASFDPDDPRRKCWTGYWPDTDAVVAFGWFGRWDDSSRAWIKCEPDHPDAEPDLNRISEECQWSAERQCWERKN